MTQATSYIPKDTRQVNTSITSVPPPTFGQLLFLPSYSFMGIHQLGEIVYEPVAPGNALLDILGGVPT